MRRLNMPVDRRELLAALGLLALLPACASFGFDAAGEAGPVASGAGAGDAAFYDARTGGRLGRRALLDRMAAAPIVLLGEIHDNAMHHRIRAGLLLEWVRARPKRPAAVVFEHLDREHNDALRLAQKQPPEPGRDDGARLTDLLDAADFDRRAWQWPVHQPLFAAAQASGATWIAANLSRASARRLSRDPGAEVDPVLTAVLESARWSDQAQQALAQALLQGHCGTMPPTAIASISRIQRLRDAALALPLLDAAERRSVLLAGNGHVRRDHGVPLYLGAFEKEALVIGFEEVSGTAVAPGLADLLGAQRAQEHAGGYDVVCLTKAPPREDPCVATTPAGAGGVSPAAPTRTPSR